MGDTRNKYDKEMLQTDIAWLCDRSTLSEGEAEQFIRGLLTKEMI